MPTYAYAACELSYYLRSSTCTAHTVRPFPKLSVLGILRFHKQNVIEFLKHLHFLDRKGHLSVSGLRSDTRQNRFFIYRNSLGNRHLVFFPGTPTIYGVGLAH
jgi:hypothetical protein